MSPAFLYECLTYVVLGTPKLGESVHFYQDLMGLELLQHQDNQFASFRCSDYATNLLLRQHDQAGLLRVGMKLQSAADMNNAKSHFTSRGYEISQMPKSDSDLLGLGDSFSVFEPHTGITFDFFNAITVLADPFKPTLTKIQRLGHVVIKTKDLDKAWKIMEQDFNFPASDYVEDKAVWMRCYPNPFHHSFAIIKDDHEGLHHVNFMVSEIDDVGSARNRLMQADVDIVFGPGRHKPSGSIFLYFTDPAGMTMEFSFGMEEFPVNDPREPRKLPNTARVMDQWGGFPKPEFGSKGQIIKS